jgi:hypothetical protein
VVDVSKATPEGRFWAKVQKTETCWVWTASINTYGYGIFAVTDSPVTNSAGYAYAHRYAYTLLVGPIPEGKQLDHLCRVRHCVRPSHLEPVTVRQNLMRGQTHAAHNAAKTHCPKGHPYDAANTWRDGKGKRVCLICKRKRNRLWMRTYNRRKAVK